MRSGSAIAVCSLFVAVYCVHAASYGAWIVDDAAISFAYARNLAAGHGAVAQPGVDAVEGFSNALWVLLLAALDWLRLFDLVWTPKVVSGAMVCSALILVWRTAARDGAAVAIAGSFACLVAAANPAFVIWTTSGLENGMLVLGAVVMFATMRSVAATGAATAGAVMAGLVASAIAFVRPDGALWCAAWPVAVAVSRRDRCSVARAMSVYLVVVALVGGLGTALRFVTFHDLVPNTFHVKQAASLVGLVLAIALVPSTVLVTRGIGARLLLPEGRRRPLGFGVLAVSVGAVVLASPARSLFRGVFGWIDLVAALAMLVFWSRWRVPGPALRAAVICATIAATAYCALPKDWMGEYRFATAFVPFSLLVCFGMAATWCGVAFRRWAVVGVVAAVLLLPNYFVRWHRFRASPTVPVTAIAAEHVPFEQYRDVLGGRRSLLTEDVGAPLLFSSLRIHDLGGLCEPVIGRTLFRDPVRLADHLFTTLRPDFLRLNADIAIRCGLQDDPRFRRDYVAIREWSSPGLSPVPLGHFVRRDVLRDERQIADLRALAPK